MADDKQKADELRKKLELIDKLNAHEGAQADSSDAPISLPEAILAYSNAQTSRIPIIGSNLNYLKAGLDKLMGDPRAFKELVKENAGDAAALAEKYPNTDMAGKILGTIESFVVPGKILGTVAKGEKALEGGDLVSRLLRIVKASAIGGGMSAAENQAPTGEGEAFNGKKAAVNAAYGAGTSALLGSFFEALQAKMGGKEGAARAAFNSLKPTAPDYAEFPSAGEPGKYISSDMSANTMPKTQESVGKTIIKKGLFDRFLPSRPELATGIASAKEKTGQMLESDIQKIAQNESLPPIQRQTILDRIKELLSPQMTTEADEPNAMRNMLKRKEQAFNAGGENIDVESLNKAKTNTQKGINYESQAPSTSRQKMFLEAKAQALREAEDAAARESGVTDFPQNKADYGNLSSAEDIIKNAIASDKANPWWKKYAGIGTVGLGTVASRMTDHPEILLPAVGLGSSIEAAKRYGPQSIAQFLLMNKSPVGTAAQATQLSPWIQMMLKQDEEGTQP